ncbi:MAG: DNA-binding protein [Betaproteobacteria bacterium]|nr:DNA-binding protein [Betaproteobacteria bacterium]
MHLDELDCLALLNDFGEIRVPDAVWTEVSRHRPRALETASVDLIRVRAIQHPSTEPEILGKVLNLHHGEMQALLIAQELAGCIFLSDDTAARFAAKHLGIASHGTIGITIRAIRRGLKSREEVLAILRRIPVASSLHIRASLLDEIIREVEDFR